MFNLRREIQGIGEARTERNELRALCHALRTERAVDALSDEQRAHLIRAATRHGVLGVSPLIGAEAMVLGLRAKALRTLTFTRRVVEAIEGAQIPVVVLKGAAAASRWPDPTVRQQSDVDVLVEKPHKDAAAHVLISAGLCAERFVNSDHMHNDSLRPAHRSGVVVEVHHYLNNHHHVRVDVADLLARRVRVPTAAGPMPALSPEDDAIYLALHAATHALRRLAWLFDIACLRADWSRAADRARQWGVEAAVGLAWRRARELLDAPIPPEAIDRLRVPSVRRRANEGLLYAAEHSSHELRRTCDRALRLSLVPLRAFPRVVNQVIWARREEHAGYQTVKGQPRREGRPMSPPRSATR